MTCHLNVVSSCYGLIYLAPLILGNHSRHLNKKLTKQNLRSRKNFEHTVERKKNFKKLNISSPSSAPLFNAIEINHTLIPTNYEHLTPRFFISESASLLHKIKQTRKCDVKNYGQISLLLVIHKNFERSLLIYLQRYLQSMLHDSDYGFSKGRSCIMS